ncbi:MAG TPA: hypothetical protein VJZ91_16725, partial [Blastocatellia bacterium]|nr:hypothetical protein [Blastocatellia bacterium]
MNATAPLKSFIVLLLVCGLAAAPLAATRHERSQSATTAAQQNDDDADGVTFDNLLRASSYTLYIEVRNVGAVLRSPEFRETFEPISPMLGHFVGGTETTLVRLVTDNADRLQRSRVMLAFSPADSSLPALIVGVEMESEDAAKEFEAMAKERFASLAAVAQEVAGRSAGADPANGANPTPTAIRRADRLIVISFTPFTFKALRGANDESMSDDMNFRAARDRFYAEPLFVYYDVALSGRKRKALEETLRNSDEEITNTPSRVIVTADSSEEITVVQPRSATTSGRAAAAQRPAPSQASPRKSGAAAPPPAIRAAPVAPTVASPAARKETDPLGDLLGLMLSGESQEPEAVAIALALEHDALIARALMIGPPGATAGPLPFLSPPISGPAISSEAAGYLPADTGIFVAASLDWARLYDLATHPSRKPRGMSRGSAAQLADFDARRAAFEKASGVRLADLLASALGNEVALSVPASYLGGTPLGRMPMNARAAASMPLMLVAVRDREALAPRLPALLEALGIKPANAKAAAEKVGDVEITSYGNIAYAFVNNYLMMAANVASLRQALEARAGHTTLADDRNFQSYTEWQPRASVT